MAINIAKLIDPKYAENAQTTQYTSPSLSTTIIDKFTATNISASAASISVNLVTSGDIAGTANKITDTRVIASGETYTFPELIGQVLQAGDFISTIASAASAIVITAGGRIII